VAGESAIRRVARAAWAVALLMMLQIGGCALVGSGDPIVPIFCTASVPRAEMLALIQALLLIGFLPLGLAALAVAKLRRIAIIVGIVALAGLAMQYAFLANGTFYCDSF
jgi:hypothetical protein